VGWQFYGPSARVDIAGPRAVSHFTPAITRDFFRTIPGFTFNNLLIPTNSFLLSPPFPYKMQHNALVTPVLILLFLEYSSGLPITGPCAGRCAVLAV
jgi:hypothetical protein